MHISQVNEITSHRIISGSEHLWNCFPDARYLDYESEYAYISVLFNPDTQQIYEADISIKEEEWDRDVAPYRWINPSYKQAYITEAESRNVDPNRAWDDVKWIDLEVEEDWLEKAESIFNGKPFDTRVKVPIELDDKTMLDMCMKAHERDITLNQLVEEILLAFIEKHKNE
jgi:hypothetical protein